MMYRGLAPVSPQYVRRRRRCSLYRPSFMDASKSATVFRSITSPPGRTFSPERPIQISPTGRFLIGIFDNNGIKSRSLVSQTHILIGAYWARFRRSIPVLFRIRGGEHALQTRCPSRILPGIRGAATTRIKRISRGRRHFI